jgi:DNA-binding PadR family transcriptional regulator
MAPPTELTASGAAVLSLLTFGEASGYELRTRADATLRFFFAAPAMSQVYAELDRLAAAGLVASRDLKRPGARPGKVWRLTAKGTRRLARWAAEEPVAPTAFRHHLALRVMLGGLVGDDRLRDLVAAHRERVAGDRAALRAVADGLEPDDPSTTYAALVAQWGLRTYDAELAALDELVSALPA